MPVSFPVTETVVGSTIRRFRKRKGIFGRELAAELGVSSATLSRWERGREFVPLERREQIAEALNFDPTLIVEPGAVEVTAEERGLLSVIRRMPPSERAALHGLIADFAPAQERTPC